jgi:hypothetical protein
MPRELPVEEREVMEAAMRTAPTGVGGSADVAHGFAAAREHYLALAAREEPIKGFRDEDIEELRETEKHYRQSRESGDYAAREVGKLDEEKAKRRREQHLDGVCNCEFPGECLFEAGYKACEAPPQVGPGEEPAKPCELRGARYEIAMLARLAASKGEKLPGDGQLPDDCEQRIRERFSEASDVFAEVFYRDVPQDAIRPLDEALMAFLAVVERHPLIDAETVICSDCAKDATSACEVAGHGLDRLGDLIETAANGPVVRDTEREHKAAEPFAVPRGEEHPSRSGSGLPRTTGDVIVGAEHHPDCDGYRSHSVEIRRENDGTFRPYCPLGCDLRVVVSAGSRETARALAGDHGGHEPCDGRCRDWAPRTPQETPR